MSRIAFNQLPQQIQGIFCPGQNYECKARGGEHFKDGRERYYVKTLTTGETTVFVYQDGNWTAIKHYG
jgi:hypothetical protein